MTKREFPADFVWGVATSSHQIEGAFREGGRGESIWDRFAATPGRIEDGSDASVACDHYHRWPEDVKLLGQLGVRAYRFSIAWPRVVPSGRGEVNEEGLDFYDRLVDALLAGGIRPFVTLYHWDLPQALQDRGGWVSRETTEAFGAYATAVAGRLGDRVQHWVTHNEPWCIATQGHEKGEHAPGHRNAAEALRVAHHVLLSHGLAVAAIRDRVPQSQVGIVLNLTPAMPVDAEADDDAVRRFDGLFNRWYLDPVFRGRYPEDAVAERVRCGHLESTDLPFARVGDLSTTTGASWCGAAETDGRRRCPSRRRRSSRTWDGRSTPRDCTTSSAASTAIILRRPSTSRRTAPHTPTVPTPPAGLLTSGGSNSTAPTCWPRTGR
jgi:beta-glucosidase